MVKKKEVVKEGVAKKEVAAKEVSVDKAAYQKAFDDISKKLGVNKAQLDRIEKHRQKLSELVEYEIPYVCKINGKSYPKKGRASRGEVEMLVSMAGAKRMRLIREKVSHKYEIEQLASGQIHSRLVSRQDEAGETVSAV